MNVETGTTSESVQFMQFDAKGNLFVYEPGDRCSGTPHKIDQEFTQEELEIVTSGDKQDADEPIWNKFGKLESTKLHRLVPKSGETMSNVGSSHR